MQEMAQGSGNQSVTQLQAA